MNKLLLKLVMLFTPLWKRVGADIPQLKAILEAKLKTDDRKPISFGANKGMQRKRKKKKVRNNTSFMTMMLSFFMGMVYVLPILIVDVNAAVGLTLFYSLFVFFFTFTLLTDFVNVLVDTKDKLILFPKPITDKTIILSRLLYMCIYIFRLAIPMSLPAWIVFGIMKGWIGALWFPIPLIMLILTVIFLVSAFYIIVLRFSKPGKFHDVLNYVQILFSVVFFATYMLSSRIIDPGSLETLEINAYSWVKYVPTYWLATAWSWIDSSAEVMAGTKWLGIPAFIFPFVGLWLTVKYLAPHFVKSLVASDNTNTKKDKKKVVTGDSKSAKKQSSMHRWADIFSANDTEKAGFILTWLQTQRSRTFRMRVLPTFAYVPVYFLYILTMRNESFEEVWLSLPESKTYITLLYMSTFVIMQGLAYITISEQYKASWIFYSSPVKAPGEIIAGSFKAMWAKYFLPFMGVISIFVVYVWGAAKLLDVALATVNVTLFTAAQMYFAYRMLPFSAKEQIKDKAGKSVIRVLLMFILIGVLGVAHYLTSYFWWLKMIFLILSAILLWMLYDSLKNTPWSRIRESQDD